MGNEEKKQESGKIDEIKEDAGLYIRDTRHLAAIIQRLLDDGRIIIPVEVY